MDSDKREDATTVQYTEDVGRPSKKKILIAHAKRFWWAYLIFGCCCVALAVPLTIFVGIKHLAQSKVNKSTLAIQGITVTNASADSFTMSVNSTIKGDKTKATVRSFIGAMYLEDEPDHTPFAHLTFPQTPNKPMQAVNISQLVPVENMDALTTFNTWMIQNESVRVTILGNTHVKVPGIKHEYPVKFQKTITLAGLNGFHGMRVANTSVTIGNFSDGTNFHTTVTIPNASPLSFQIGNATFATFLQDTYVGPSYLDNIYLKPGDNVYPLRALIAAIPILNGLDTEPFCGNSTLPFSISGRSVVNNGQNLTYFANALAANNDTVEVPLKEAFDAIGISVGCPTSSSS